MILIITGRSGSGKSTIAQKLIDRHGYRQIRTCTTRQRREGESEDAYYFLTKEEFVEYVDHDDFIEYDVYGNTLYGTLKSELQRPGKLLCVMTPEGAKAIKRKFPEAFIVCVNADMRTSILRVIKRESELDLVKLDKIHKRAIEDQILFADPVCDLVLENPENGNLNYIANRCMLEHVKFYLQYASRGKGVLNVQRKNSEPGTHSEG